MSNEELVTFEDEEGYNIKIYIVLMYVKICINQLYRYTRHFGRN